MNAAGTRRRQAGASRMEVLVALSITRVVTASLIARLSNTLSMELRSLSGDYRLNLTVNNAGRVTVCSPEAEHAIPGYEICPQDTDLPVGEAF